MNSPLAARLGAGFALLRDFGAFIPVTVVVLTARDIEMERPRGLRFLSVNHITTAVEASHSLNDRRATCPLVLDRARCVLRLAVAAVRPPVALPMFSSGLRRRTSTAATPSIPKASAINSHCMLNPPVAAGALAVIVVVVASVLIGAAAAKVVVVVETGAAVVEGVGAAVVLVVEDEAVMMGVLTKVGHGAGHGGTSASVVVVVGATVVVVVGGLVVVVGALVVVVGGLVVVVGA